MTRRMQAALLAPVLLATAVPAATSRHEVLQRAHYQGKVDGDAVAWSATYHAELATDDAVTIPLLPVGVTLQSMTVDGREGAVLIQDQRHATRLSGRGRHVVETTFRTSVMRQGGSPRIDLEIPIVPLCRLDLTVPGRKDVQVSPAGNLSQEARDGSTVATVHVPMTDRVSFYWRDVVPEAETEQVQATAEITHVLRPSDGLLQATAHAVFDVRRGQPPSLSLLVPSTAQVQSVVSPSGAILEWRLEPSAAGQPRRLALALAPQSRGEIACTVAYEQPLPDGPLPLPLLEATGVLRQRGLVAILPGDGIALDVDLPGEAVRVGEDQLPPAVRDALEAPPAQAFRYPGAAPPMVVRPRRPERAQVRFDAQVDTLVSVGETTLTAQAQVLIDVRAGAITEAALLLPADVVLLSVHGPSLGDQRLEPADDGQRLALSFTQEMRGKFRVELACERLLAGGTVRVPRITVAGAQVEQGLLAIEAASAAQVTLAAPTELPSVPVADLPPRLVLRTSNPILMAYRYTGADPAPALDLSIERHRTIGVLDAAIETAVYQTLVTRDGLQVTTADFMVRNDSLQFLGIALPPRSTVWEATVDGRKEKPAQKSDGGPILLRILSSTRAFPVRLVYATPGARIGEAGIVRAKLPRPDILVTRSAWHVYLPEGLTYRTPASNMDLVKRMPRTGLHELPRELRSRLAASGGQALSIEVPESGKHIAFEKLYANQERTEGWIRIPYASTRGTLASTLASLAAGILVGGAILVAHRRAPLRRPALAAACALTALLVLAAQIYGVSLVPTLVGLLLAWLARRTGRLPRPLSAMEPAPAPA